MLSLKEAQDIAFSYTPNKHILATIEHKNWFLFAIYPTPEVTQIMDPFYSVDRRTGYFKDFAIYVEDDFDVIMEKFNVAINERRVKHGKNS